MYFTPRKYRCPKCKELYLWSESHDLLGLRTPICLTCYTKFILENVPEGEAIKEEGGANEITTASLFA